MFAAQAECVSLAQQTWACAVVNIDDSAARLHLFVHTLPPASNSKFMDSLLQG